MVCQRTIDATVSGPDMGMPASEELVLVASRPLKVIHDSNA